MGDEIITIGLSPAWDRTIEIDGTNWNRHKTISLQKTVPAGKAFNLNKAFAWLGEKNTAAGLWGSDDYAQMRRDTAHLRKFIKFKFTKVPGKTRQNITIVDTKNKRQMHFREKNTLTESKSLKLLQKNLRKIIIKRSFCFFSGSMPQNAVSLVEYAKKKSSTVVIDTSGPALKKIVAKGGICILKLNLEELGELAGRKIKNEEAVILSAAKKILNKAKFVLVSRGAKGAIVIFRKRSAEFIPQLCKNAPKKVLNLSPDDIIAVSARYIGKKYPVYNTVGCGDFFLAGFTHRFCPCIDNVIRALKDGVKVATVKAFGLDEKLSWPQANSKLKVRCSKLDVK
jgi:fructose-1-phosphate kinase PfkB-like protein